MAEESKHKTLEQLKETRREKLNALRKLGVNPYPYKFDVTHKVSDLLSNFEKLSKSEENVSIAGRLMSIRGMGKVSFAHLQDQTGKIQIHLRKDEIGDDGYDLYKLLDIGDYVGISGHLFVTKTGEQTVWVKNLDILSKSIRPLPIIKSKDEDGETKVFHEFTDKEQRYRQRYADLAVHPEVREIFVKRTKIVTAMRNFLDAADCMEVDTPVLQPMYGGAMAEPFVTHHNALNTDLYLRIADELYLKRLLVGGFERVYEFSRDFRNEGMDRSHNPEFTMLELYVAYWDYTDMKKFVEDMISTIAMKVNGTTEVTYRGVTIDLKPPWKELAYYEALKEYGGIDLYGASKKEIIKAIDKKDVDVDRTLPDGKLLDKYFDSVVEPNLDGPIFIKDYPLVLSPLAKKHRDDPNLVERFEPFLFGMEIGNAFSELNDPIDQRERFEMQAVARAEGDAEAQHLDEDYIRAMEYGMPPNSGLGIGIERLVMILTDSPSIKDVILFPLMKPEE
ncbi:MAG: lysine--tRNA ligase [Candidatus Marinimicrobia bacterium]|nr:lysine--tRNA ligase [Candidatus Neomarinimicrobiota bacterium]